MEYIYFVSYLFPNGHGRGSITRTAKIFTIKDILGVEKAIAKDNGIEAVSLSFYSILTGPTIFMRAKNLLLTFFRKGLK